jgi:hypothetical protein
VVGLDNAFSWRNVAASAVGATVAGYVGGNGTGLVSSTVRGQISAYASAVLKDKWFGGARPDFGQVAADAFGNTLGDFMVSQLRVEDASKQNLVASLATNQWQKMLDSGELPDTLTTAEVRFLARETEKNQGVLPVELRRALFKEPEPLFSAGVYEDTDLMSTFPTHFETGSSLLDMTYGLNSMIHNGVALGVNTVWAGANAIPIAWAAVGDRTFDQASQDVMVSMLSLPGGTLTGRLLAPSTMLSNKIDLTLARVMQSDAFSVNIGTASRTSTLQDVILIGDDVPVIETTLTNAAKPWKTFADNIYFTDKVEWTATRPKGTGQTYTVIQRNDVDWGIIRSDGPKDFIGRSNAEAAAKGLSPQLRDGSFATLHHMGQDSRGALAEASTRYHGVGTPGQNALHSQYGKNIPNPNFPIDRRAFSVDTREYWQWRVKNQ